MAKLGCVCNLYIISPAGSSKPINRNDEQLACFVGDLLTTSEDVATECVAAISARCEIVGVRKRPCRMYKSL